MIVIRGENRRLPCLLYDKTDFITPETGVGHASVTVWIRRESAGRSYPCDMGESQVTAAFNSIATGGSTTTLVDSKLASKYADDYFNGMLIRTLAGTGSGQNLVITDFDAATNTFTFSTATAPDSTTTYRICKGVVDSAGNDYIVDSILTEANDYWNDYEIQIIAGTGAGQVRTVSDFDAATDKIIVDSNWDTNPDNTSVYSLCNRWTEVGFGLYDVLFDTVELGQQGFFRYLVTDAVTEYLDYHGLVEVEIATTGGNSTDIGFIRSSDLPAIKSDTEDIEAKVDILDTNVDTIITTGSTGPWTTYDGGLGTGQYTATINVKVDSVNVQGATVTIHNASNDDDPWYGPVTTDLNGNAVFTIEGNVYVRVSKAAYNFTATAKNITASGTYNVTGTANVITPPSDPDLCRLYLFPITLDNQDVADLVIHISSKENLTKVNGEFVKNAKDTFTIDTGTDPDSYYYDAVQTALVHIVCVELGIDKAVTVPAESTKDLDTLIP